MSDSLRYAALIVQLGLLLLAFHVFRIEEPVFLALSAVVFTGFLVHYWLPHQLKEPFLVVISMAGAYAVLEPSVATLVLTAGILIYLLVRYARTHRVRVGLAVLVVAVLAAGRWLNFEGVPTAFWAVIGAVFMFRLIIYLYDLKSTSEPPRFREFATYFFMLPNYYFLLFPVVDFKTMRAGFLRRETYLVAQQGIGWMARGTIQLLLYRLIVDMRGLASPDRVTTLGSLIETMVLTYLLYLRVSGTFHISVGMLKLFGYDLPTTHRRYLLASSIADFWRRINIYWKDFMKKLVHYPVYFRLRRRGERTAHVAAVLAVFFVTWLLHSYQYFWLTGSFLFSFNDALFWAVLCVLMIANILLELRKSKNKGVRATRGHLRSGLQVAATFGFITVLWTFWYAPNARAWLELVTYWQVG